jgi:hypothetical protein
MRRVLALALITAAVPATALAANPYDGTDLPPSPVLDKALIAHERARTARAPRERAEAGARARAKARAEASVAIPAHLQAIAACESGGNPRAIGGGGLYRGAFQMSYATWASVGGRGDPAAAPMAEQVRRAAILYAQAGPGQWPVCGA